MTGLKGKLGKNIREEAQDSKSYRRLAKIESKKLGKSGVNTLLRISREEKEHKKLLKELSKKVDRKK